MSHLLGFLAFLAFLASSCGFRDNHASDVTMAYIVSSDVDEHRLIRALPHDSIDFSFKIAGQNKYLFLVNNSYGAVWTHFPDNAVVKTFLVAYQSSDNASLAPPRAEIPEITMGDLTDEDLYLIEWTFILTPNTTAATVAERYSNLMKVYFETDEYLQGYLVLGNIPQTVCFFGNMELVDLLDTVHSGVIAMEGPGNAVVEVTPIIMI